MKFSLKLTIVELESKIVISNTQVTEHFIEGDSLLELANKFTLLCVQVQENLLQKEINELKQDLIDDDIPF